MTPGVLTAMSIVAGFCRIVPAGDSEKIGEYTAYPVGAGAALIVTVIVVSPGRAPAGMVSDAPPTVTVPPAAPTVCDALPPSLPVTTAARRRRSTRARRRYRRGFRGCSTSKPRTRRPRAPRYATPRHVEPPSKPPWAGTSRSSGRLTFSMSRATLADHSFARADAPTYAAGARKRDPPTRPLRPGAAAAAGRPEARGRGAGPRRLA